ncbi:unnamed protein product [Meloidogyne enterolobii]|uniref:Uncharacterized protein n=1 Tax=Meloidogyne enterolobii TaxID=390850 RepID=A0ACB0Z1I9_MELEN
MAALFDASTPATPYFSSTSSSSSSPSSSSSSSSHFSPSNKQQLEQINNRSNSPNSDHYDTPWEFKNRTLAAILENQRQEQQQQLKHLEKQIQIKNPKNNEVNIPNSNNNNQRILNNGNERSEGEATVEHGNRLSFPANFSKMEELKTKNFSNQPIQQQLILEDNIKTRKGKMKNDGQLNSNLQPNKNLELKIKNNKESPSPPPLPAHKNNLKQLQNNNNINLPSKSPSKPPLSPLKSNFFLHSPNNLNNQNLIKIGDKQQQKLINERIKSLKLVLTFCQENSFGEKEKLNNNLIHENMERAEAELLLGAMPLGSHLLRRRPDRSLALSLKANEGVLHIKLEYRCDRWVLGEGPRFNSVVEMLKAYRRVELPVRGAEQIRLTILFRPGDMPGRGLLLL